MWRYGVFGVLLGPIWYSKSCRFVPKENRLENEASVLRLAANRLCLTSAWPRLVRQQSSDAVFGSTHPGLFVVEVFLGVHRDTETLSR